MVSVWFYEILKKFGLVSVSVRLESGKKPDRTGPLNPIGDEKGKEKETKGKTANVAEEKESTEENYAFLIDTENLALVCTLDFQEEALKTGLSS